MVRYQVEGKRQTIAWSYHTAAKAAADLAQGFGRPVRVWRIDGSTVAVFMPDGSVQEEKRMLSEPRSGKEVEAT
jgi:hypothetical protein